MAQSRGKARRAQKQKKRREGRRKERAARRAHQPVARSGASSAAGSGGAAGSANDAPGAAAGPQRLSTEQLEAIGYDPLSGPEPKAWLALDEGERMENIQSYHRQALAKGAQPPNLLLHASMHLIVENQLAGDEPVEARPALLRLMRDGASRHDAVHALGWLVMRFIKRAMSNPADMDHDGYRHALTQLTLQRWLDMAQG